MAEVQAGLTESGKGHHGNLALDCEGTINALKPDGAGHFMCRLVKAVNVLFSAATKSGAAERTAKDEGIKGEGEMEGRWEERRSRGIPWERGRRPV